MNQRNLAGLLAAPLLVGLWVVALTQPLPVRHLPARA